jgi:predicted ATPase/class 3 adenylate cyclase
MKENPLAYIPMDRRQALARSEQLPDRASGAALFADISGFTPLTEALVQELGRQRGAEELTRYLNLVYDALINELHSYGGSAIAFAGDAITCWFDGDNGCRAVAAALSMQRAMDQFAAVQTPSGTTVALAMKASVAAGPVRRFVVGDPSARLIDAIAGATLERLAAGEHLAGRGEVVVDEAVMAGAPLELGELRRDDRGRGFGVVKELLVAVDPVPWPALAEQAIDPGEVRRWLLPSVYALLEQGMGQFLAELRPTVALFLRFSGIDYDRDPDAGEKLDRFIRWVQEVVDRRQGTLIDLNIGDKGSYIYINFGAPIAHEDGPARAAATALELRSPPQELDFLDPVQIGISQGRMRAGAYGGSQHRTYGVLGDAVNLSARLMMASKPGEVLVSESAQRFMADKFVWDELPPIKVKGKSEPVTVFALREARKRAVKKATQADLQRPLIGRRKEISQLTEKLELARSGSGQIVTVFGNAGIGKSRLVAEVLQRAEQMQFDTFGGECEAYGINTSYLVWQPIWRALLGVEGDSGDEVERLIERVRAFDPRLARRTPLMAPLLNLPLEDNDLTRSFDPKLRKTSLESMLVDLLRKMASDRPMVLVLDDCQWMDSLSHELLGVLGRAIADRPVLLLLISRPVELERLQRDMVNDLPFYAEIALGELGDEQLQELAQMRLSLGTSAQPDAQVPDALLKRIVQQAEGNPFYVEEIVNYIRYNNIDPFDSQAVTRLELPASLHGLVLSRIDQLPDSQKTTLKVASVIGRVFRTPWLWGVYPDLGEPSDVGEDLEQLSEQDLTEADPSEPGVVYNFKHMITHGVVYESLLHSVRSELHEHLGHFLELSTGERIAGVIDLLAYHFDHSANLEKRRHYLRLAGEAAQASYANEAALDYYARVLRLLNVDERVDVMLRLGEVLRLVGRWEEAATHYNEALQLAETRQNRLAQARCFLAIGDLERMQGNFAPAWEHLSRSSELFEMEGDRQGVAQVLHTGGTLAAQQGDYSAARARFGASLETRRAIEDRDGEARLLNNLAIIDEYEADLEGALALQEESLSIRRQLGDPWAIANSLNNLGNVLLKRGQFVEARARLEEAVALLRDIGDQWRLANALNNLGNAAREQADYGEARRLYVESIGINRVLGDRWAFAYLLEDIGSLAALQHQDERALVLVGAARSLRSAIGAPLPPADQARLDALMQVVRRALKDAALDADARGEAMGLDEAIEFALSD